MYISNSSQLRQLTQVLNLKFTPIVLLKYTWGLNPQVEVYGAYAKLLNVFAIFVFLVKQIKLNKDVNSVTSLSDKQ